MKTDMVNLNNRLERLEATNKPEVPLEWTEEEKQFRDDINCRMKKTGTTFYHEVCNDEEFERIKQQSTKCSLIWYRNKLKNESNELE